MHQHRFSTSTRCFPLQWRNWMEESFDGVVPCTQHWHKLKTKVFWKLWVPDEIAILVRNGCICSKTTYTLIASGLYFEFVVVVLMSYSVCVCSEVSVCLYLTLMSYLSSVLSSSRLHSFISAHSVLSIYLTIKAWKDLKWSKQYCWNCCLLIIKQPKNIK